MTDERQPTDSPIQMLGNTFPKADSAFQQALEQKLIAHFRAQQTPLAEEKMPMQAVPDSRRARPVFIAQSTWVATFATVMVAVVGVFLVQLNQNRATLSTKTPATPTPMSQGTAAMPEGYSIIGLPLQPETLQGLKEGDRVDVLTFVDDEIRVMASNLLISDIQPTVGMFSAPSWQHGILIWLYQRGESYALRLYTGTPPPPADETLVDFVFISPEPLPDGYTFDLIVNVPASKGYLLTGLPVSIDDVPFTASGNTLHFWFKNIEVLSIVRRRAVTVRMPAGEAANLKYLIDLGMDLTFNPDADASRR